MVSAAKKPKKAAGGRKFEYKPDIYDDDKFTEQKYWEAIANKENLKLELSAFDLRPFAAELYQQQLP